MIGSRVWVSRGALVLGAALSAAGCGSSGSGDDDDSTAGESGAGASGGSGGTSAGGTSRGGTGAGGAAAGGTSAGGAPVVHEPVQRPFWCEEYKPVDAEQLEGWVTINPSVIGRGSGNMTSPIQSCTVTGSGWSVEASGLETDGVDGTTMSFELSGIYDGPGRYQGKLADGITVSFSHDDLGVTFSSTPASECELCINDDGLSGTVQCRALESPLGSELEIAHLPSGQFTCTGAAVKPSTVQTKPAAFTDYSGSSWLCHYLEELDCPGRTTPTSSCIIRHDKFIIDGPCSQETSSWEVCISSERPSQLACADEPGNDLVTASGNCETERAAMDACRALAGVSSGAGGSGGGGTGGGAGIGGAGIGGTSGSAGIGGTSGSAGAPPSNWTVTPCAATPPSCADLAHTCGANGDGDCCESDLVPGGDFFREERFAPATVHSYCLDKYEVSAGRMRRFLAAYPAGLPTAGIGKNPYNADDLGWDAAWSTSMPTTQESMLAKLNVSSCSSKTWHTTASETAPESENLPINCIDWYVAYAFCAWDGGWLPTQLEWKFAARAGNEQRIFPWSVPPDNRQHDTTQATFACDSCDAPPLSLVGAKPPGDGLYGQSDLSGNVMEWVQDWHAYEYPEPCNDCANLTDGEDRELLGGSATSYDTYLAPGDDYYPPIQTWQYIGFRCARGE